MAGVNQTIEEIVFKGVDQLTSVAHKQAASVKELRGALDAVKGALAAVGVTAGAGAFVKLHLDAMAATAALNDFAQIAGSTVEGISAIERVAKVGGKSVGDLAGQLGLMIKGLRSGSEEGGRAAYAFEYLGIKTRDSNGRFRDTTEILTELAQKLKGYHGEGEKVAIVQDALGKGAERFLPLLKDMGEATDLQAKATKKQADAAEEAEKNMRRLNLVMEDGRKELVNQYTPALNKFLEQLLQGAKISGGFGKSALELGVTDVMYGAGVSPKTLIGRADSNIASLQESLKRNPGQARFIERDIAVEQRNRAYAQFLQRQEAMELAGPEAADARDLGAGRTKGLAYDSGGAERKVKQLKDAEEKQKEVVQAALAASRNRDNIERVLNPFYVSPEEQEALGGEIVRKIIAMREDINAKIAAQIMSPTMEDDAVDPEKDQRFVALQNSLRSAEQLEIEDHERRMNQLAEFSSAELEQLGGIHAIKEQYEQDHRQRMLRIQGTALQLGESFQKASMVRQASTIFGELANITAGVSQHNKQLFEINKVAGIANAIINTYTGVSKSLAAYPMPFAAIMAAVHLAAGLAQVTAISKTQFGGSGVGAAPSIAGSTAAMPVSPVQQAAPAGSNQTFVIETIGDGDKVEVDAIENLFERLNEKLENGGRFVLSGRRRRR